MSSQLDQNLGWESPKRPDAFPVITWMQARTRSSEHEPFLVEGLVSSDTTVVYGAPNQGKTRLAASLIAELVSGATVWLGHKIEFPVERIVVCTADDGALEQY